MKSNCPKCGIEHEGIRTTQLCKVCGPIAAAEAKMRYRDSEHGKQTERDYLRRWRQTPKGIALENRRRTKPNRRETLTRSNAKYRQSVPGKIASGSFAAKRAGSDPLDYRDELTRMHTEHPNCTKCSQPYNLEFQLDHIVPIAFEWTIGLINLNQVSNLQPLCKQCHRAKTNKDVSLLNKLRRGRSAFILILVSEKCKPLVPV